jgi:hypothetical protein
VILDLDVPALAKAVAREVVDLLRAGTFDLVDQSQSPLGRRRHIALCRRRTDRCVQIGRRYLAPKDLVEEELAKSKPRTKGTTSDVPEGFEAS